MRTPIALFLLALVARLACAALFPEPAYPDSFYYVNVARELAAGHGFNVDVIWIFPEVGGRIPANPVLPIPSNAHWMPLASVIQVPFIWLLGPTAFASAIPFAIAGSFAAPLSWLIARDAGTSRAVQLGAGILTALPALSFVYMVQPDNFSLYQPLVAGALFLGARGLRGSPRAFALAGLLAGVATLSRNDGILVMAVLGAAWLWDRLRTRIRFGADGPRPARVPFAAAVGAVVLFAVTVGPWYLRQLAVFGSLSPSTASGKVLFIRDIGEWNSITVPATLEHLLGMGLGPLLLTRIGGLVAAVMIFSVLVGVLILVPFLLIGAWSRRRDSTFGPYFGYAALLFAFSALVSAVHVPGGTFIHSAVALAPHGYVLALEGIVVCVAWMAARRRGWNVAGASRVFVTGAVAFAVLAAVVGVSAVHGAWSVKRERMQAVAVALDGAGVPPSDRLMSIDASGYRYWTGRGGVVLVNDPIETVEAVARAYAIRWLILEKGDSVPAASAILAGVRPAWVGPPILVRDDVSVFPVCADATDARCPTGASR
ncbi:MAG: glycosyltransferase family 39 protein [Candidatus Limnocylindrales bacterium]